MYLGPSHWREACPGSCGAGTQTIADGLSYRGLKEEGRFGLCRWSNDLFGAKEAGVWGRLYVESTVGRVTGGGALLYCAFHCVTRVEDTCGTVREKGYLFIIFVLANFLFEVYCNMFAFIRV